MASLEENRTAFIKEIEGYFVRGETQNAFEAIHDLKNYEAFQSSGFELIPILGKYVTSQTKHEKTDVFKCAQQILDRIAREFNPQETYLELLEQAEDSDDVKFVTVLESIKYCLFRMPKQRAKSLCWVCATVVRHLCHMEAPLEEDEEENGEDNSKILENISLVYEGIIDFFLPIIKEPVDELDSDSKSEESMEIMQCLLKCLGRPLVHVDLTKDSKFHDFALRILNLIENFNSDPLNLLKHVDLSFDHVETLEDDAVNVDFTNVSLGCYFYLIFEDGEKLNLISHVFSPKYLFECAMALVFDLMGANDTPLVFKGLKFFNVVLDRMSPKTIEFNTIQDTVMCKFLEMIVRSMVHNNNKDVRLLSVKIFPKFVEKFTLEGQYMVLYNADQLSPNPGFIGYSTTLVKERVREALDTKDSAGLRHFTGKKLVNFLNRYCKIGGLIEADLQTYTDQIVSCLNLIRYILIRDKNNETDAVTYLSNVDQTYLEPVMKACSFSRGLHEEFKAELHKPPDRRFQVNIAGSDDVLQQMSPEEHLQMINENLTRIDMIDCLASRVSQCLDEYKLNNRTVLESDNKSS